MSAETHPTPDATIPPATNGAVPHVPSAPCPSDEELARQIVEFEKQFPPPDTDAILANARWLEAHWGKPELTQYRGFHVAVFGGAVVGHGLNSLQLQLDVARKYNVHPQSFLVEYVPPAGF